MSSELRQEQPLVWERLDLALKNRRLPHALLFLGSVGSGQVLMAREVAKGLFCPTKQALGGCGACAVCKRLDEGNHPDLRSWEPEEDSRNIKIETVRQIIAEAHFKPFEAPVKLFILQQAEFLNEVAQNALLKTLEEPPAGTYFVLIAYGSESLLPTLRSRAQTLHFKPGNSEDADAADLFKHRTALSARVLRGREAVTPDLTPLTREQISKTLNFAVQELREAVLIRQGAEELVGDSDSILTKRQAAQKWSTSELIDRIEKISFAKDRIERMVNAKLALSELWDDL